MCWLLVSHEILLPCLFFLPDQISSTLSLPPSLVALHSTPSCVKSFEVGNDSTIFPLTGLGANEDLDQNKAPDDGSSFPVPS